MMTKLSFRQFRKLQDAAVETVRYELDEGELVAIPSSTPRHSLTALRLWSALADFAQKHQLGVVTGKIDFRLSASTVLNPDVAFIAKNQLKGFDPDRTPIHGAPALAVEVISPGNRPERTLKKVRHYLAAGTRAVWLSYPKKRVLEIHETEGVRRMTEHDSFREKLPFSGIEFSLSFAALFDDNAER